jgi:hypothetical protein
MLRWWWVLGRAAVENGVTEQRRLPTGKLLLDAATFIVLRNSVTPFSMRLRANYGTKGSQSTWHDTTMMASGYCGDNAA